MRKNKVLFFIIGICVLAFAGVFCLENNILPMPYEKKEENNKLSEVSGEIIEKQEEQNHILYTNDVSIEILSCNMIEDTHIESQTAYKAEWFKAGELPDAEYEEEYIDYEAVKEACPELRELWENEDNKYTIEETKEIYNRNLDVIEQYTTMRHPKTRYFFVTCRITNLLEERNEAGLALDTFISFNDSESLAMHDNYAVYFDKAVYTTGEERGNRFFWYPFEAKEVLECVLGYEIKEENDKNEEYYLGVQTPGADVWTFENTQLVPLTETGGLNE